MENSISTYIHTYVQYTSNTPSFHLVPPFVFQSMDTLSMFCTVCVCVCVCVCCTSSLHTIYSSWYAPTLQKYTLAYSCSQRTMHTVVSFSDFILTCSPIPSTQKLLCRPLKQGIKMPVAECTHIQYVRFNENAHKLTKSSPKSNLSGASWWVLPLWRKPSIDGSWLCLCLWVDMYIFWKLLLIYIHGDCTLYRFCGWWGHNPLTVYTQWVHLCNFILFHR